MLPRPENAPLVGSPNANNDASSLNYERKTMILCLI